MLVKKLNNKTKSGCLLVFGSGALACDNARVIGLNKQYSRMLLPEIIIQGDIFKEKYQDFSSSDGIDYLDKIRKQVERYGKIVFDNEELLKNNEWTVVYDLKLKEEIVESLMFVSLSDVRKHEEINEDKKINLPLKLEKMDFLLGRLS